MRLRLFLAATVVAAFAAFVPTAGADITPSVVGEFADPTPGAHSNYTNTQTFTYSGSPPYADDDDLRKWIIDGPAGQIGNPNAIPKEDRCTQAEFDAFVDPGSDGIPPFFNGCPPSSRVGSAGVVFALDANGAEIDANGAAPSLAAFAGIAPEFTGIAAGHPELANATPGSIFILDTDPEIPVILGTYFHLTNARTQSSLEPVTSGVDGDFRIRVTPTEDVPHRTVDHDGDGGAVTPELGIHVTRIMQHLNGATTGGADFLTNPPRCGDWNTYSYATEYDAAGNTNADASPVPGDGEVYKRSDASATTATCTNLPFGASLKADVVGGARDSNPTLNVVVSNPGAPGIGLPKKITTTLPATLTTDLQKIVPENICSIANRDAGTCQPSSKVGTVSVKTPFLTAGLTGDVYITKGDNPALPNLAVYVTGAISFRLDATNTFVGPRGNQIQTTFDDLPQTLFTEFALTIPGGTDTLLTIPACKSSHVAPEDGPITASLESYTGQTVNNSSATNFDGCYGKPRVSSVKRCVKYKLKFTPRNLINRAGIMKVEVWVKGRFGKAKRAKVYRKSPFRATVPLTTKRFTSGRSYKYKVRVVYKPTVDAPKGKVLQSKYAKFKKC